MDMTDDELCAWLGDDYEPHIAYILYGRKNMESEWTNQWFDNSMDSITLSSYEFGNFTMPRQKYNEFVRQGYDFLGISRILSIQRQYKERILAQRKAREVRKPLPRRVRRASFDGK